MRTVAKSPSGPFTTAERIIITIPVLMASLLHALNMSTTYVALPTIQGNLSATPDQIGWVITGFVVASAVGTVLTGWFSVRLGRRQVFLMSIVGFCVTSLLCGSANGLEELVFYRMLQGFVSAPLLPISQAIMLDTYPRERHGFAMSIWSMGMILGPVAGPTVGAMLTEWYDWRYLFFFNIPFGLAAFVGVFLTLPASRRATLRFDWIGAGSLILGVFCLQMTLDRGERLAWFESPEIVIEATIAALSFYVFIVQSVTSRRPYINPAVFTDRNFVVGLCLIFVFGIAVFSSLFVLPLFLQHVQDYPVLEAGKVVSVRGLGTMLAMMLGGQLADRLPAKYLILTGLACVGFSNVWMTQWDANVELAEVIWVTIVNGFGMGIMWVTLTTVTFSTLAPALRVEGAALFSLIRAIGASMGTSVVVMIIVRSSQVSYIELRDHVSPYSETLRGLGATSLWNLETTSGLRALYNLVLSEAQMIAFLNAFVFLVGIAFAAMPLVFLLKKPREERS